MAGFVYSAAWTAALAPPATNSSPLKQPHASARVHRIRPVKSYSLAGYNKSTLYMSSSSSSNSDDDDDKESSPTPAITPSPSPSNGEPNWQKVLKTLGIFTGGVVVGAASLIAIAWMVTSDFMIDDKALEHQMGLKEKVALFDIILSDIDSAYVDPVDTNKLFETGVNAMLSSLDPYTQFENLSAASELMVKTSGKYGGVGLGIGLDVRNNKDVIVVSAFEGYAYDAGLRPGDIIVKVNDVDIGDAGINKTTESLRGEPGTSVKVQVKRAGLAQPLDFELTRQRVTIHDVPAVGFIGDPKDKIGYIRLQSFAKQAGLEVHTALQALKAGAGGDLKSVILDLRGNPGGLLDGAVEVAEQFVPKGSAIVSTKGRALGTDVYISNTEPSLPANTKLAVLVDGGSASASEIVAGAIQDLDVGVVVGSKTYGKGLVQNIQGLPFDTALRYTVGRYYTPSGRCIQAINYANGNTGDVKKFEDSARKEFKTKMGRVVKDLGGIEPDVVVDGFRVSDLEGSLLTKGYFLTFADKFYEKHPDGIANNFAVDDSLYKEFQKFAEGSGFRFETKFEKTLEELSKELKLDGYQRSTKELDELKLATVEDMKDEFSRNQRSMKRDLERYIRMRYEPDSMLILDDLKYDEQVDKAIEILRNRSLYTKLLSPKASQTVATRAQIFPGMS